ncbi:MAG: hypothetical protein IJI22_03735 [Bacilli bacterium]|nr:hypothetical protein [Bacilli bacterium]
MDYLIRFGFSIEDIKNMMDTNIYINSVSDTNVKKLIDILEKCDCTTVQIRDILLCNPFYLNQEINTVKETIKYLEKFGFKKLNILFGTNPYLLNLNCLEISEIINTLKDKKASVEEIIDYFNYNLVI